MRPFTRIQSSNRRRVEPASFFYSPCTVSMSSDASSRTIKDRLIDLCRELESFRLEEAIASWRDRYGDEGTETYMKTVIRDANELISLNDTTYVAVPSLFDGAEFRIFLIPPERQNLFLLFGHRVIPFVPADRTSGSLTVLGPDGDPLDTSIRTLEWDLIKRFNTAAPARYQVASEGGEIAAAREQLLEQNASVRNGDDSPLFGTPSEPDYDEIRYRLDMELSEQSLDVRVVELPFDNLRDQSLLARVEDYREGVISVRPDHVDDLLEQRDADRMEDAVFETMTGQSLLKQEVEPLIERTFAEFPDLMDAPGSHWVHPILDSDRLEIRGLGVDPVIHRTDVDHERDEQEMFLEFGMEMMFGHLVDEYEEAPRALVEEAQNAWERDDDELPGYIWAIEQLGTTCHEALLDLLRSGDEETSAFVNAALENSWDTSLEKPLRFVASDERVAAEARMIALSLLMEHGSDDSQEFAARTMQSTDLLEQMDVSVKYDDLAPEEFVLHNKDARENFLHAPLGEAEQLIHQLGIASSPAAFFAGTTLVYSGNRDKRQLGADLIVQSGHAGSDTFLNELSDHPLSGLRQLSSRPVPVREEDAPSVGTLSRLGITAHDARGGRISAGLADFGEWTHGFVLIHEQEAGLIDASFEVIPTEVEDLEELIEILVPGLGSPHLFPIDRDGLREELLEAERRTLSGPNALPDEFKFAKPLLYLPRPSNDVEARASSFMSYWNDPGAPDAEDRPDLEEFSRAVKDASVLWGPLCHFENHDLEGFVKSDPGPLCEGFLQQLEDRVTFLGRLYYLVDDEERVAVLRDVRRRIERARTNDERHLIEGLTDLLEEWKTDLTS